MNPVPGGAVGRGRGAEPAESLRRVALDVRGEIIADCGHRIPEAQPERLVGLLREFFAPGAGGEPAARTEATIKL